jgi:methyl-accepting chemotaxis protein
VLLYWQSFLNYLNVNPIMRGAGLIQQQCQVRCFVVKLLKWKGVQTGIDLIGQGNALCRAIAEHMLASVAAVEKAYAGAEALDLGMGGVQETAREINRVVDKLSGSAGQTTDVLKAQADSVQQLLSNLKRLRGEGG